MGSIKSVSMCLRKVTVLLGVVAGIFSANALAWDTSASGKILQLHITDGNNFGLRVILDSAGLCTASQGSGWAYLNVADDNFKMYAAALMQAKATGSTVTLYTNIQNGYCHIGYMILQ